MMMYKIIQNVRKKNRSDSFFQWSDIILVMAALVIITSRTVADADLWGHLRFGLDILENGKIAQVDPYSYLSAGQRWINHEWLAEFMFALIWSSGGSSGLILFKTSTGVICLCLIFIYLLNSGLSKIRAGILVIIASLVIMPAIATVRPQIITLLFSAIIFIIIAQADSGKYRWLWAAPPIFALWVNFHGGFLAGLGFLGIWAAARTILHREDWLRILPPVLLSFFAVLLNPYGIDLIIFLLETATIPRPEIVEWQPLQPVSLLGGVYLVLLVIMIVGLVYSRVEKSIPLLILLGIASVMPFVAVRHLPLFSLAVLVFGGVHIADAWSRVIATRNAQRPRPRWLPIISIILAIGLLMASYKNFLDIPIPGDPNPFFPIKAVSLLKQSQVTGNLAIPFNWGEYTIWHLGPEVKVSIDGRRETVYPDDIYKANLSFQYGIKDWDSVLEDYETNMVLVNVADAAFNLIRLKPGWELIYEDSTSAIFASQDWDQIEILRDHAATFEIPPPKNVFP